MSFPDSMFLFEIVVEDLQSFTECKQFYMTSKFADVFKLTLRDPNSTDPLVSKKRFKKRIKVREDKLSDQKPPVEGKVQSGQSILFTSPITKLITTMKNSPIEVTFFSKDDHRRKIGSVRVPWSPFYIDYLYLLATKAVAAPIMVSGSHNVYDETTSRFMATIVLNIKLTHLGDKLTSYNHYMALPSQNTRKYHNTTSNSKPNEADSLALLGNQGTIKTLYSGGKSKKKTSSNSKTTKSKTPLETKKDKINEEKNPSVLPTQTHKENISKGMEANPITLNLVKSDNDLNKNMKDDVVRSKSCAVIDRKHFNFLNYMFDDAGKPLGNRVFCVGYCTVENEFNEKGSSKSGTSQGSPSKASGSTDNESPQSRNLHLVCNKECVKRIDNGTCIHKPCNRLSVTQCDKVRCSVSEKRKLPPRSRETIQVDLSSLKKNRVDELESVVGGMTAKMNYDEKNCFCECECTFGFVKRTTYCGICGGFEKSGEDLTKTNQIGLFPCPIYHKSDKNRIKSTSGSDRSKTGDSKTSNKKGNKSPTAGKPASPGAKTPTGTAPAADVESDKEYCRKKKRERNDDRFKFNYGYTGIRMY